MDKQKREQTLEGMKKMGRMDRVKDELAKTIVKLSSAIQKSHSEGKIPSDYSLGFANGAIFFEHMLSQRDGGPTFFDRTTSIGALPIPVALRSPGEVKKEFDRVAHESKTQEERYYESQVVAQARGVVQAMEDIKAYEDKNPDREDPKLVNAFSKGLAGIRKTIIELDEMMTKREEALHAHRQATKNLQKPDESSEASTAAEEQESESVSGTTVLEEAAPSKPQPLRIANSDGEQLSQQESRD